MNCHLIIQIIQNYLKGQKSFGQNLSISSKALSLLPFNLEIYHTIIACLATIELMTSIWKAHLALTWTLLGFAFFFDWKITKELNTKNMAHGICLQSLVKSDQMSIFAYCVLQHFYLSLLFNSLKPRVKVVNTA